MGKWTSVLVKALRGFRREASDRRRVNQQASEKRVDYVVQAHTASDIGCVRDSNQDAIAFLAPEDPVKRRTHGVLAVVADGMGGHNGGEVASTLAVETIARAYFAAPGDDPKRAIERAMAEANTSILAAARQSIALDGMGTTATALVLVGDSAWVAHIGDSRLYRVSGGRCRQITEDDTLVGRLVQEGLLSAEQAREHPARNVLLRSLGTHADSPVVAKRCATVHIGDYYVLCSDGLHGSVDTDDIAQASQSFDLETACRFLIDLARERDGRDNISVGVVSVRPAEMTVEQTPEDPPPRTDE